MDPKNITLCLEKARMFLEENQQSNGSWSTVGPLGHKEPPHYQKEIILTPEAISTLILANNKDSLASISKAMAFCMRHELSEKDHVDLWAWRAIALSHSNTEFCQKLFNQTVRFLEKQQNPTGYWPCFPSTFNLTNYSVLYAIRKCAEETVLKKARDWLFKNKAKDGFGWGFNHESSESAVSFTGNIIFASVLAGADPLIPELQEARKFLEKKQLPDGGWPSSKTTVAEKSTTYGTSFATISLMLLSENPFNKLVETGVKYLLDVQNKDGGWSLIKGERSEFYTTYYVVYALAFYKYLRENLKNPKFAYLKDKLKPQQLVQFLLQNFEDEKFNWLSTATAKSALTERMLGSTFDSVLRRKDILQILSVKGELTIADIIDALKENKRYEHLNKRSHITLIKNDIDYLRSLNLVYEQDNKYFVVVDLLG